MGRGGEGGEERVGRGEGRGGGYRKDATFKCKLSEHV